MISPNPPQPRPRTRSVPPTVIDMRPGDAAGGSTHVMIEGPTGTGKTVEITEGILDWADRVGPVLVCDPTGVEYRGVQDRPNVQIIASTVEDMIAAIRHVHHEMTGRYQALASEEVNENDLAPLLLVIDDYPYFKTMVEQWWAAQTTPTGRPNKCPALETVGSLARKGRTAPGGEQLLAVPRRDRMVLGQRRADARKVLTAIGAQVLDAEVLVPHAYRQFDSTGRLVDADLRHQLERLVAELHTSSLAASDGINETAA